MTSLLTDSSSLEHSAHYLGDDLLLHEVDAHGDEPHAQQDVDGPQHQLGVRLLLVHVLKELFGLENLLVQGRH